MGGWLDDWMDGWTDGWMHGWMDRWMHGWMEGWIDKIFAGPTAQWRVRPRATIHLSNQLPVYCYLFQILFTVSVRGAWTPRLVIYQWVP